MNYKAIGITTHDLQMGSELLIELQKEATFPFLSATLVDTQQRPLFIPHIIINKNNLQIGIIGLTEQTTVPPDAGYQILDWRPAVERSITALKDVDLVIVLSNLSRQDNIEMAKAYDRINIILEAGQPLNHEPLLLTDNTLMSHTEKEGKYIGELHLNWLASKTWETNDRPVLELKNEIDRLLWFKNRIEKRGGPAIAYKNKPAALDEYKKKMTYLLGLEKQLREALKKENSDAKPCTYQAFMHPLKPSILDEPQTSSILKRGRKSANKLRRKTDVSHRFDVFAGSKACQQCHQSIYKAYTKTRHSKAYPTLIRSSDNNNPNCIFCHVTGLPERLAFVQAKIPERLLEVGCESCHGAGQEHSKKPKIHHLQKEIPETTCLTCHTDDHSDDFDYDRDIEFVH